MAKDEIILGIDLGTTTSQAFYYKNGKSIPIKNEKGNVIIKSIVTKEEGEFLVDDDSGFAANAENYIYEIKRMMGTSKKIQLDGKSYTPIEISSDL